MCSNIILLAHHILRSKSRGYGGLMVSALDSGWSSFDLWLGHCVGLLNKTLSIQEYK